MYRNLQGDFAMPWCPSCKLEYVEGIKVCPDCKTALVDSLEDNVEDEFDFTDDFKEEGENVDDALGHYFAEMDEDEREDMIENMKKAALIPKYKSKEEAYTEHKSGAVSLTIVGILGIAFVVLNALKLISLPIAGNALTNIVMGSLFVIFLVCGILSFFKASKLKPEAIKEKEIIAGIVDFIKERKQSGAYKIEEGAENFETEYIKLNDRIVSDIEEKFNDLEPGLAYYVTDRFAGDILDED